jgi:hypothetical protein
MKSLKLVAEGWMNFPGAITKPQPSNAEMEQDFRASSTAGNIEWNYGGALINLRAHKICRRTQAVRIQPPRRNS